MTNRIDIARSYVEGVMNATFPDDDDWKGASIIGPDAEMSLVTLMWTENGDTMHVAVVHVSDDETSIITHREV